MIIAIFSYYSINLGGKLQFPEISAHIPSLFCLSAPFVLNYRDIFLNISFYRFQFSNILSIINKMFSEKIINYYYQKSNHRSNYYYYLIEDFKLEDLHY